MTTLVLVVDPDILIPDDAAAHVKRVQLSDAGSSQSGGTLKRIFGRSRDVQTETLAGAIAQATNDIVVVANQRDFQRVAALAPKAVVLTDLSAALELISSRNHEPLDATSVTLAGDPENLYRMVQDRDERAVPIIVNDDVAASGAISRGVPVAVRDESATGFITVEADRVRFNADVDAGYYGVRAQRASDEDSRGNSVSSAPQLLIAPANYAGQSWAWAQALRQNYPGTHAYNLQITPKAVSGFAARTSVTATEWRDPSVRLRIALDEILPSSHVIVEAMRAVIGARDGTAKAHGWDFELAAQDVLTIHNSGRRVALLFHGSEVRSPRIHETLTPSSPFLLPENADGTARLQQTTDTVHRLIAGLLIEIPDLPLFVSTPDLLDYVPQATWLPVVVPPRSFDEASPALERERPRILHAPTNPFLKGSDIADEVLTRLDGEGLIEYVRVQGVPSIFMADLIREVDVVVDQVVLGNPGVLAAETMAAGRLAVAHLPDHIRARYPAPIVEANRFTLEAVIREIAAERSRYAEIARAGSAFTKEFHDGAKSAGVLHQFLQ